MLVKFIVDISKIEFQSFEVISDIVSYELCESQQLWTFFFIALPEPILPSLQKNYPVSVSYVFTTSCMYIELLI